MNAAPRLALLVSLAMFPAAASAVPATIVDEMTGARFVERPTMSGTPFQCLGVGSRKQFVFKVYSVAFCMEAPRADEILRAAHQRHPGRTGEGLAEALEHDQRFFESLLAAPGEKMIVLRFARDIDRGRLEGAFRDAVQGLLPHQEIVRLTETIGDAIGPKGVREGDVAVLRSQEGAFVMEMKGLRRVVPLANAINARLWRVWLGSESVTENLKESIAMRASQRSAAGGSGTARASATAAP